MPPLHDAIYAIRQILASRTYRLIVLLAWFIFLLLFAYLTIFSIPGNDIEFFFSISQPLELAGLLAVSLGMALVATMNVYILRVHWHTMKTAGIGLGALAANMGSLVLISASCTACLAGLAGVVVAPILFTLFEFRAYAITGSILLLLFSLHYASQKIVGKCEHCKVSHPVKNGRKK